MLRKVGWQFGKSTAFRIGLYAAGSQSTTIAAWGYAGTVAMGAALPYAAPFAIYYWTMKCIGECDTCRDSGNKAFYYH